MEEVAFVSMVDENVNANSVEEVAYVIMVDKKLSAKIVEEVAFVSMVDKKLSANYVNCAHMDAKQWTVKFVIENK